MNLLASREILSYVGIDFLNYVPGFLGGIGIYCMYLEKNFEVT